MCFLEISAPRLRSLREYGRIHQRHRFIDVSSLVDVFISSVGREGFGNYTKRLSDLTHVQILTICTATLRQVGGAAGYNPQEFGLIQLLKLQELQLLVDLMSEEELKNIFTFFQFCPAPNIEKFFIRLPVDPNDLNGISSDFNAFKKPQDITFNHLKVVKLNNFRGSNTEMILVKFLLQKAVILEYLVIVAPSIDLEKGADAESTNSSSQCKNNEIMGSQSLRDKLSMLPKASPNVNIILCDFMEDDTGFNPLHTELYCERSLFSSVCEPSIYNYVSD
ncbi:uncharacterized protein A4U43_C03F9410 [Asparagus officinalis]|uniref:FBD domain-containing protein n=2 Tax=Asparagus officinalis TaxID=4686 RepID=A0A5P1F8K8_ASPOF|nr:uncharacterized protein A4U43_C03F9410 [Asparagus officinalis]